MSNKKNPFYKEPVIRKHEVDLDTLSDQCLKVWRSIAVHKMTWLMQKEKGIKPKGNPFMGQEIETLKKLSPKQ